MEPAAATTTPPPSERHRSPKVKRQRSAAAQPLGDVTNLLLPSTPTNPITARPRPLPSDTTAAASTCSASPSHTPVSKPSSATGETAAPQSNLCALRCSSWDFLTLAIAAAEERSLVKSAISTVYTRRNTTQKRRRTNDNTPFPAGTASCPPPATLATKPLRLRVLGLFHPRLLVIDLKRCYPMNILTHTALVCFMDICYDAKYNMLLPGKTKSTRMENTSSGKHMLPEDFVKKQRAYFEEVDAFELPEEEASETDLE
ncbi:Os12g0111700 [Oryza sativa Japonica Group]|uniref:Os12g0111700 protein n=1 Tax=Oryza sativa subsp. japonica TaxID=39947 RepID=Q0IQM6_ORYSJ|nr:Os12g0111700 [Oryza sativa Japonica Group]|eukprot:NP_001065970.1 Os12g0111700 [Oryza sativa Japonica Group]